jgi:hypothetical protein
MIYVYIAGWVLFGLACISLGTFVVSRSLAALSLGWLSGSGAMMAFAVVLAS